MASHENMHTGNFIQTEQVVFSIYTYTCIHTMTMKKGNEFEREQGGVYGRICREGREGENAVIIVSKI